ncbi:MAG TPA: polymer-forming cytoskeletal protein [Candidatus Limnocylindria bacterium]|nr:polymer-forming cytoskeletal protein [Candidatus Limnocylindria bacterium]
MVFGSKRDNKSDALSREDVVGNLYPDSLTSEVDVTPSPTEYRRNDAGNESVIDPHARFNGKYVSDRDLRIEGEAQGEIECQGTLIISPQARVRSAITAHNVIINGDYEGDVDCGGRFEIGSTGRVKGAVKTQVLVVKEGAHWEGSVVMTHEARPPASSSSGSGSQSSQGSQGAQQGSAKSAQPVGASTPSGQGSIFSKQDRDAAASGERTATGPGSNGQ